MTALLDIDQLRTFIAIAETGSFTKAAEVVNKTQSAVSMQMKRLEERIERPIFARDGRASKLTEDGSRLLDYARRLVKLNVETVAAFSDAALSGRVRLGRAGRLRRPLSAGDHGALLARLSGRRADGDLRAVGRPARAHRRQRDRSRHRHQLRNQARLGNFPARAAVVGDVEPARHPSGGAVAAGARAAELHLAAHCDRAAGIDRTSPTACSIRARMPARWRPPCSQGWRCRCWRNQGCAPACACSPRRKDFPNCRAAASGWCATRTTHRPWRMRWPSTSSPRSTICRKRQAAE